MAEKTKTDTEHSDPVQDQKNDQSTAGSASQKPQSVKTVLPEAFLANKEKATMRPISESLKALFYNKVIQSKQRPRSEEDLEKLWKSIWE